MRAIPEYYFLLRELHRLIRPARYLEIGVQYGESLALAEPETRAAGVDPQPEIRHELSKNTEVYQETSETFFKTRTRETVFGDGVVDLAFIDGMHLFEFALDDFIHIEQWAGARSLIVIHDTVPDDALSAQRERESRVWTGDVYKLVLCLKRFRPELAICNLNIAPSGLCLVGNLNPGSGVLAERRDEIVREFIRLDYSSIAAERDSSLGVRPASDREVAAFLAGLWNEPKSKIASRFARIHLEVRDEFYEKLQSRCASNHALLEEQKKTLNSLQQTVAKRDEAIDRFKREREALSSKVRLLEDRNERFCQIAELQKELRDAVAKRDGAIERFKQERETLLAKVRLLEDRNERFRQIAELQKELRDAIAKRDEAIDRFKREREALFAKVRLLEDRNERFRKIAEIQKELRDAVAKRDEAIDRFKREREALFAKVRLLEDRNERFRKIAELQKELRDAIAKRDDALERLRREKESLLEKNRQAGLALEKSAAKVKKLGNEMEKCHLAIEWRDRTLEKAKQRIDELTISLAKHRAAIDKRDAALLKHKAVLLKRDDTVQKCRAAIAKRDNWLAEDRTIIDKQKSELRLLEKALAELRNSGSYRIGCLIAYLPLKIKAAMQRLHNR